jgi:hypothetical protein
LAGPRGPAQEPNEHGRAHAMTVVSLLRPVLSWPPGGVLLQRLLLGAGVRETPDTIRRLSFIHFARLVIIRKLPNLGQPAETLREPLMLFESNYNGTFDQYIDAFAEVIPLKMRAFWGTSYGFPGARPVTQFKTFIRANEFVAEHYYSAYPTATTTMITAALDLRGPHESFYRRARSLTPEQFARAYRAFLTTVQANL